MSICLDRAAFLAVDVQNDFCEGGALAVPRGDDVVPIINTLARRFPCCIATQDWHPAGHVSFALSHAGAKPFELARINNVDTVVWPDHCVQGTRGADFHPELDMKPYQLIVRKGFRAELDSYSAFFENDGATKTGLDGWLKALGIHVLCIAGLALDYCVYYSAVDAAKLGFTVFVVRDATRSVGSPPDSERAAIADMHARGVAMIQAAEIQTIV